MWIKISVVVYPINHFFDLLIITWYLKREIGTLVTKTLIELKLIVRINCYLAMAEILVEQTEKIEHRALYRA